MLCKYAYALAWKRSPRLDSSYSPARDRDRCNTAIFSVVSASCSSAAYRSDRLALLAAVDGGQIPEDWPSPGQTRRADENRSFSESISQGRSGTLSDANSRSGVECSHLREFHPAGAKPLHGR